MKDDQVKPSGSPGLQQPGPWATRGPERTGKLLPSLLAGALAAAAISVLNRLRGKLKGNAGKVNGPSPAANSAAAPAVDNGSRLLADPVAASSCLIAGERGISQMLPICVVSLLDAALAGPAVRACESRSTPLARSNRTLLHVSHLLLSRSLARPGEPGGRGACAVRRPPGTGAGGARGHGAGAAAGDARARSRRRRQRQQPGRGAAIPSQQRRRCVVCLHVCCPDAAAIACMARLPLTLTASTCRGGSNAPPFPASPSLPSPCSARLVV